MRIALVTTPAGDGSRSGAAARAFCEHLPAPHVATLFVHGAPGAGDQPLATLRPREHDQVLYPLADEPQPAFALPWLRRLGGTVWLLEEELRLPRLACAASPALVRGGLRGVLAAARHGGLAQARAWSRRGQFDALPPLQRGVTRQGDAFVLHREQLAADLLGERNEPTPIAVLSPLSATPDWQELAAALVEALARFPHARSARRPLIVAALRAAEEARAARQRAD